MNNEMKEMLDAANTAIKLSKALIIPVNTVLSSHGIHYTLIYYDEYENHTYAYLLQTKSPRSTDVILCHHEEVHNQFEIIKLPKNKKDVISWQRRKLET